MSSDLERLIGRAVVDKGFRDSVLADPESAARDAGLQLTSDELDQIKNRVAKINADPDGTKEVDAQFSAVSLW